MRFVGFAIANVRGVGAIEFALMAPVLALLLVGALDFGRLAMERSAVGAAARAGALFAAMNDGSGDDAIGAAALAGAGSLQSRPSVRARYFCICPSEGEIACKQTCFGGVQPVRFGEVSVTTMHETLLPYPGVASPLAVEQTVRIQVI